MVSLLPWSASGFYDATRTPSPQ